MLSSVEKLGRPSLGDLATREQIQPPSVTRLVRTLEEAGLVELVPDDVDRRSTRVVTTALGRRELSTIRRRKTEFLESRLRALPAQDQARAAELADLLEHLLDQS